MSGWVYFIRAEVSGLIKVGWTGGCPEMRFHSLRTGSPEPLTLMGAIHGCRNVETSWHQRHCDSRANGEWFKPSPELLADINSVSHLMAAEFDADIPLVAVYKRGKLCLRKTREASGLSLAKAAKRFGLSLSYLSELETGSMPMTLAAAKKIAAKSDLSVINLLGLKERA